VEVITLPVSDVEPALRFYVDQVGFTLDVDYSPNDAFGSYSSLHRAPTARYGSVSPTGPLYHFATSMLSSPTLRLRGSTCSNVGSKS
jgi:catechol 2,3-dioxygenase-like lactoylglutathione lyase family enzyme